MGVRPQVAGPGFRPGRSPLESLAGVIQPMVATAANLSTLASYVDTEVAAIKAKTDNLPSDPADQSQVEAAITPRTRAIVPVHLFGLVADMDMIRAIADRHGARLMIDEAHCTGLLGVDAFDEVAARLREKAKAGRGHGLVVVAEGARPVASLEASSTASAARTRPTASRATADTS